MSLGNTHRQDPRTNDEDDDIKDEDDRDEAMTGGVDSCAPAE